MIRPNVIRGFVLAATIPVALACIGAASFVAIGGSLSDPGAGLAVVVTALFTAPISIVITALLGVPAYYLASRFHFTSFHFYLLTGGAISLFAFGHFFVSQAPGGAKNEAQALMHNIILIVILFSGPLATLTFWAFVRPDRLTAPAPNP